MSRVVMVGLVVLCACGASASSESSGSVGRWEGAIGPPEDLRRFAVTLRDSAGRILGTLDLPESGLVAEPLSGVRVAGDSVAFVLETDLGPTPFAARVAADSMRGVSTLGPHRFPFALALRPPPPTVAREETVGFANGNVRLAGTLFMPPGEGRRPAVVMIAGSGAQPRITTGDRARIEAYARAGFAVLAYDKRGVGGSTGDYRRVGLAELAGDALAGVEWLRTRADIDGDAIGLHGRSQGCWIAEIAASRSDHVAWIVAEVGGGVPPWRQELYRVEAEMRARGESEPSIAEATAFTRLHYAVARGDSAWSRYEALKGAAERASWSDLRPTWRSHEQATVSWERLVGFDPAPVLASLRTPVLFALAESDRSTPTRLTAEGAEAAARGNPKARIETMIFAGADHAMLTYPASGIPRLPEGYPDRIIAWVRQVTKR